MGIPDAVQQGRAASTRQAWGQAFRALRAAADVHALGGEDLDRLAMAAHLTGHDPAAHQAWSQAYDAHLAEGEPLPAARSAFWLGILLMRQGERARGGGWLARAGRIAEAHPDAPEQGYVMVPVALGALESGDAAAAGERFDRIAAIAGRCGDADLAALAGLGRGQALLQAGDGEAGLAQLDETMLAVQAGTVSPLPAGIIYCGVIGTCQAIADVHRAREWTAALTDWCDGQPDLVPFRGQCLVHRSQILQFHGQWAAALELAQDACARLAGPPDDPAVGDALYQQAELQRLRGQHAEAEGAYRDANRWGRSPQPGLALLRLAEGDVHTAAAALRRALEETPHPAQRGGLLAAQIEVLLASGDAAAARSTADALDELADALGTPVLQAVAAQSRGAVLLAQGETSPALNRLREAWQRWQQLEAPFDAARTRILIGIACGRLGDEEGRQLELDAARAVFRQLGAAPQLRQLAQLEETRSPQRPGGLTDREMDVLRLVADGHPNKDVAAALVISEHTVARHLQNIFTKLDVDSRTAAAAFAYQHGLL